MPGRRVSRKLRFGPAVVAIPGHGRNPLRRESRSKVMPKLPRTSFSCLEGDSDLGDAARLLDQAVGLGGAPSTAQFNLCAVYVAAGSGALASVCTESLPAGAAGEGRLLKILAAYTRSLESQYVDREVVLAGLGELASEFSESPEIAFNHASLAHLHSGLPAARPLWERFLRLEPSGPYADLARNQLGKDPQPPLPPGNPALQPPVPLGRLGDEGASLLAGLGPGVEMEAAGERWEHYQDPRHRVLYRLGPGPGPGEIVMIERVAAEDPPPRGKPRHVVPSSFGEFRRYTGVGVEVAADAPSTTVYFLVSGGK